MAEKDPARRLEDTIDAYHSAIEELPTQLANDAAPKVLRALLTREAIALVLSKNLPTDPTALNRLIELDHKLKAKAATLVDIVERESLSNWRKTIQPTTNGWWWLLDDLVVPKPNPFWTILSFLFLVAAAALTAEISRRFLSSGGSDLAAISIPLLQAILTVLSGSTLTQTGQEIIERFLSRHHIAHNYHPMLKTAIPLIIFLVIGTVYLSLPRIAGRYARRYVNQQAFELQMTGKIDEAIKSYERAISLDPDFATAHYNLGVVYEVLGDYDKAITEYQTALRVNTRYYLAHNNLARLLLLRRNDPATALKLLNDALDLNPQDSLVKYSIYKNRGWAHFNLKSYGQAVADLCEALELRKDGAAAYCLLAQVIEAQSKPDEANVAGLCKAYKDGAAEAWGQCVAYKAGQEHEIEASWLSLAQERLRKEEAK